MHDVERMTNNLMAPLPEVVLKKKWAGDLEGAQEAIDSLLRTGLSEEMKLRLRMEKERIRRLPTQYPWNREEALAHLKEVLPNLTERDFDELEAVGRVDFIYLNGEKRYFVRFHKSLAKAADIQRRNGTPVSPEKPTLDAMIAEIREKGILSRRITAEAEVHVEKEAFVPGEYLVHLPFPIPCAQQSGIELISGNPTGINPPDVPSRSAWWRENVSEWKEWRVTYRYVNTVRYADPLHQPVPKDPLYPDAKPVCPEDLAEDEACMRFTPLMRRIAAEITEGLTRPVDKAWAIYQFITTRVKYSFMRDYFQIDDPAEFCAVNGIGDCGLQALMFIMLCRISGIPARWQSGLEMDGTHGGCHDWAQFYLEGWGWLFADPSYGGGAWENGSPTRHAFYFGNLDPLRMVANRVFQATLTPESTHLRVDPFDHQSGEIERIGAELPFTGRETDGEVKILAVEEMESS